MTKQGLAEIRAGLESIGFKKRAGQVFTYEVAEGVLGWLGLNQASRHLPTGEVEINPVVGVRHQEIERVVADLRGEPFHPYQPPTVSSPLGYLMPERRYRGWVVGADGPGDLVPVVAEFGLPFIESASTRTALCRLLDEGLGFEHQLVYRRPVAWLLAGDEARSVELIDQADAALGTREDLAAEEPKGR